LLLGKRWQFCRELSRSGATIVEGLWQGLTRESAFLFSLLLAIPAIIGACRLLQLKDIDINYTEKWYILFSWSRCRFIIGLVSLYPFTKDNFKGKLV